MADEATRDDEAVRGGPHGDPALMRAWQRTISDLAPSQRAWLRASRPLLSLIHISEPTRPY